MSDITFEFCLDKLIHAIAFFCERGVPGLTKLKLAKLLYFADKRHLWEQGVPILGDVYFCMEFGPVPSFSLNEMNEAIDRSEVTTGNSDYKRMSAVLRVVKSGHPHFVVKGAFNPEVFSDSEIQVLDLIAKQYGKKTAGQLVKLTHNEPTWKKANEGRKPGGRTQIPYELFFEGAPIEAQRYLAKLKADFTGEIMPLPGDSDYASFADNLRNYDFEPSFELDSEQKRGLKLSYEA